MSGKKWWIKEVREGLGGLEALEPSAKRALHMYATD